MLLDIDLRRARRVLKAPSLVRQARITDRKTLRDDLRYSAFDCFLSSAMVGAGETFFPAFALALGFSDTSSGLIAAAPYMVASSLQLAAPRALHYFGSYRRWIVLLCSIQAACFLPLIVLALLGQGLPSWLLYLIVTVYWAAGLAAGPAWNAWVATLVPCKLRPRYFARRSHMGQWGLVVGMLFGGTCLQISQIAAHNKHELIAFAMIFFVAGLARLASSICLARHSEHPDAVHSQRSLKLLDALKITLLSRDGQGRFFRFLAVFSVSVYLASPFFNAFMLRKLNLGYGLYMGLVLASLLAKMTVLSRLGRAARNSDPARLMKIGLIGAAFSPLMWVVSSNYFYLVAIQIFSGFVWAIYELGLMLMLFNVVRDEERTSLLSAYNFTTAVMMFLGTTLGGSVLSGLGESVSAYFAIFALSTTARLLAAFPFSRAVASLEQERRARVSNLLDGFAQGF